MTFISLYLTYLGINIKKRKIKYNLLLLFMTKSEVRMLIMI